MTELAFRSENGLCPKCRVGGRVYYIQDAKDLTGRYIYCLMSLPTERPKPIQFGSLGEAVAWLKKLPQDFYSKEETRIGKTAAMMELEAAIAALAVPGGFGVTLFLAEKDGAIYSVEANLQYRIPRPRRRERSLCSKAGSDQLTFDVYELPTPVEEIGWYNTRSECIKAAKNFLREKYDSKEAKRNG